MKIMAKTNKSVPCSDEAVYLKSDTEYVEAQIRAEKGEEEETEETENTSGNMNIDKVWFIFFFFLLKKLREKRKLFL